MKKWICAMLCLSMVVGLASVSAEASTEEMTEKNLICADVQESGSGAEGVRERETEQGLSLQKLASQEITSKELVSQKIASQKAAAKPGAESAVPASAAPGKASATPAAATAVPSIVPTATPSIETNKTETAVPTQLPAFTGNKVIKDENVFATTENQSDKTCTITGYTGDVSVTTLYIPAQIKKKTVAAVAEGVFTKCPYLKNIVVLGDTELQGANLFSTVTSVEIWGKNGGKANAYAAGKGLLFHPLDGPAKVSVKKSTGLKRATVTWDAVNGAVSYRLYRKQGKGQYSAGTDLTSASYVNEGLKPGAKYTYRIHPVFTAANGDSIEGIGSKEAVVTMNPAKLKKVRAKGIRGGIQVRWSRDKNVNGYQVYMKVHVKGFKTKFNRVKTIKKNKTTGYRCKMLVRGMKYSYKVRSFKKVSGKTIYGSYVTVTAKAK